MFSRDHKIFSWLSKDEDDGKISRDLVCNGNKQNLLPFEILLKTGDIRHAGTDANVFVELWGKEQRSSGRIWLEGGKFERGAQDKFKLEVAEDLQTVTHVLVGHDNSGAGAGWFLDEVCIALYSILFV